MPDVAEPIDPQLQPASEWGRYERLESVDRQAAECLNEFCKVNSRQDATASILANWSMIQSVVISLPLAVSDYLSFGTSIVLAMRVLENILGLPTTLASVAFLLALIILPIAHLAGLYPGLGLGTIVEFRQLARAISASCLVFGGVGVMLLSLPWWFVGVVALSTLAIALPLTMTIRFFFQHLFKSFSWWGAPTLIVAEPQRALELYRRLSLKLEHGFRPVGVLLDAEKYWSGAGYLESQGIPVYDLRQADEVALACRATWVLASPCADRNRTPSLDPSLSTIPNRILLASNQLDLGIWDCPLRVGDANGLLVSGGRPNVVERALKRLLDLSLTITAIALGMPLLLLICLLIRLSSRGPIFYGQRRIGHAGREFKAWKFRTMQVDAERVLEAYLASHPEARLEWEEKRKLSNDPRVTQIGRFLRSTSLDELPQLWNVLRGDMSLVGPRPIVDSPTYDAAYVHEYPDEYEAYKSVRPGLTGLWQVRCRNAGVYELRIYWDMYYIRNWNIWLDLYLIMRTIKTVLFREGSQ